MTRWMTTSAELKNAEKWFEKGIGGDGGFLVAKIKLLVLFGLRSLLASSVYGIPQERILAWVAMPSSRVFSNPGIESTLLAPALAGSFFYH